MSADGSATASRLLISIAGAANSVALQQVRACHTSNTEQRCEPNASHFLHCFMVQLKVSCKTVPKRTSQACAFFSVQKVVKSCEYG